VSDQLSQALHARLDARSRRALQQAVAVAGERGVDLYLVGGGVRDLLLGAAHLDLDLVVEGDAIALATELARRLDGRLTSHPRFGTATVKGDGYHIDLARARSERYERPGALPVVSPALLADDLARRDFTINAMAFRLTGPDAARLSDPHGGQNDLRAGLIRVLHERSFQDDATRMLRAVRYAGRLGFRLEQGTERLLRRDLSYLAPISGARLRREFERIAVEERVAEIAELAGELGILQELKLLVCVSARTKSELELVPQDASSARREAIFFCVLLSGESGYQTEALISRLALTGRQARAVRAFVELREQEGGLARGSLRPSDVAALLSGKPPDAIEALVLLTELPVVRERLRRYLEEWRFVRTRLNGRDIEALGVPHGPQVGAALAALLVARLDGVVSTRDEEIAFVEQFRARPHTPARTRRG
jgi:tRNA nucleotidyltransferase (CCA-adding enzyme)